MKIFRESLLVDIALACEEIKGLKARVHERGILVTNRNKNLFPVKVVGGAVVDRLKEFYEFDETMLNKESNSFFNIDIKSNNYNNLYGSVRANSLRGKNKMLIWVNTTDFDDIDLYPGSMGDELSAPC